MNKNKNSLKIWPLFILAALISCGLWLKFGYPKVNFVNFSIDKQAAISIAENYLDKAGVKPHEFKKAIIFDEDQWADRYLQKTIGFQKEKEFLRSQGFELFYWQIRFFKELNTEEYLFKIIPSSGKIIGFSHIIEDIATKEDTGKDAARNIAEEFLKANFSLDQGNYDFHKEEARRYEHRVDYLFSWEKKGVGIPWKKDSGTAKLLYGVTVSGKEVRNFYANHLDIPERFNRDIENQLLLGSHLANVAFLLLLFFVMWATVLVIRKRHDLSIRISKKPFLILAIVLSVFDIAYIFNDINSFIMDYPTSVGMFSYFWLNFSQSIIQVLFFNSTLALIALAGETLYNEQKNNFGCKRTFLHYFKSTFFSRRAGSSALFGYIIFLIILGMQAVIVYFGQKYLGVWEERMNLTQFSTAIVPFFSAIAIGLSASFSEEITYRLFGITWFNKYLKNVVLAVLLSSLIWGFGHSSYAIFPVWFRGIEVTILGLFLGYIFIRYGIIPVLVAHYLFDVFWSVAAYIFSTGNTYLLYGSLVALALPLCYALFAFFVNRKEEERKIELLLDNTQRYNLEIVSAYLKLKRGEGKNIFAVREELINHNWDADLIDTAIRKFGRK